MTPLFFLSMTDSGPHIRRGTSFFLIAALALLTFATLYYTRSLDDNRLTSWRWCFHQGTTTSVFLAVAAGVVISYLIAFIPVRTRYRAALLFLLAFSASALFWSEPEVIVDSSRYFTQAKHLELYGLPYFAEEWGRRIAAWTDMPLVPLLYGVVFRTFGEVRNYVQIFTSALFGFTVALTYLTGKELWDEEVGFYGGILLLGMPYLWSQTPLMLVDVPSTFFLLLAVFTFLRALKKGGVAVFVAAGAITLAFFSKYSTWLMLSVLAVAAAVYMAEGRSGGDGARKPGDVLRLTLQVLLVAAVLTGSVCVYKFGVLSDQMSLLMAYQKPGLKRWEESFLSTFVFQIHPFITALAIFSAYAALRKRDLKYVIIIWLVVLVVVMQIKRIRYIIMVFPMLSLAASYGLREIQDEKIKKFISACAVTSALAVAVFAYLPFLQKLSAVNMRDAGRFLNTMAGPDVDVFTILPADPVVNPAVAVPVLDIFTEKRIHYDYHDVLSPASRREITNSALRFTVDYKNPPYYESGGHAGKERLVAVISENADDALPADVSRRIAGYKLLRTFGANEGIFRYRTCVRIYEKS